MKMKCGIEIGCTVCKVTKIDLKKQIKKRKLLQERTEEIARTGHDCTGEISKQKQQTSGTECWHKGALADVGEIGKGFAVVAAEVKKLADEVYLYMQILYVKYPIQLLNKVLKWQMFLSRKWKLPKIMM